MSSPTIGILLAARRVANFAEAEGALEAAPVLRPTFQHMGAVVADAVLQAGLNYATVVRPRVATILQNYPETNRVSELMKLVKARQVTEFLNWGHATKVERFEQLVMFLARSSIETSGDLHERLGDAEFCTSLRTVNGIGPKTVDYLSCLVGRDAIAVDRHVRAYASRAGVSSQDYDFLRDVFCSAADLLSLSRRVFDAWIWRRESLAAKFDQMALSF